MEKVVYVLWRDEGITIEEFSAQLRGDVADALGMAGARGVQVNVADDAVAGAVIRLVEIDPQMEAVVGVWLDTAAASARRPIDDALAGAAARMAAYLVTESEPLSNTTHPAPPGARTHGFANIAFLRRPPSLPPEEWLDLWQNHHTRVAIDTQSTFGYVQNVVVRPLTPDAPRFDGIVEELFPPDALRDLHVFFDAAGDDEKLARNMAIMNDSTTKFGANQSVDVVPTSRYVIRRAFAD